MNTKYANIVSLLEKNQPLFRALGDMNRQRILLLLACDESPLTVGELARRTVLSRPAVSHHLRILKQAGLLNEQRDGVKRYYTPTFRAHVGSMRALVDAIDNVVL